MPRSTGPSVEVVRPDVAPLPVLVHVPHAGVIIPAHVRAGIQLDDAALAGELRRMTDHRTDVLAAGAVQVGAVTVVNRLSRLVVDPERFPDPTAEEMEAVGMGPVYTATSDGGVLRDVDEAQRGALLDEFFRPYAATVARLVGEVVDAHGHGVIVDVHSYPRQPLPYELYPDGERPQVCLGTDPDHTPDWLSRTVVEVAAAHGLTTAANTPFRGAYVPLDWHGRDDRVTAVMLEIRRDTYLDEATATAHAGEQRLQSFVTEVVRAIGARRRGAAADPP